ncbi:hypothetical protein [Streptomyces sp. NPDC048248]|uniref:hypothetical protein n=1 Tax=Streptomyces sp. NPDC048248 TaxID=3365523 RepID=UPI003712591D
MATISRTDAQERKAAMTASKRDTKVWHALTFETLDGAVEFVNYEPAQIAGEFAFSNRSDGQVDTIVFL